MLQIESSMLKLKKKHALLLKGAMLFLVFFMISCDNSLEPLHEDSGIYSFYASMDMNEEVNHFRIRELNAPFTTEATKEIDAVVTLENLDTGEIQVLKHERQAYEDIYLHNFAVENAVEPDTEYELRISRSDGVSETARALTPTKPEPVITPAERDCFTPISVEMAPVYGGTMQYEYKFIVGDTINTSMITTALNESKTSVTFNFTPSEFLNRWGGYSCQQLTSAEILIYYKHYGPGFYERIANDSLDILESTKLFGAYYEETLSIPFANTSGKSGAEE